MHRVAGLLAGLALVACQSVVSAAQSATVATPDATAISQLAARWSTAAAARDGGSIALLSASGRAYYPHLQQLALRADAATLQGLEPIEQLQVMLLRLMLEPAQLQAMDAQQLLSFALQRGLIGTDLREGDTLRELEIKGKTAKGRLYKFGRDDWPDRNLQYFVREDGEWRMELRGELERLRADFDAFLVRSGLAAGEAAFFILETRLMRKITPADFDPPLATDKTHTGSAPSNAIVNAAAAEAPSLRLVAIRHSLDDPQGSAVMLEDRVASQRYVLRAGDILPSCPGYRLTSIDQRSAVLRTGEVESTLRLEPGAAPLGRPLAPEENAGKHRAKTLLQLAEEGRGREGMMSQWRNVGLRDRAQLLQQAWLTADYTAAGAPQSMAGLRVRKLVSGSFWDQLGLQEGDVLTAINGMRIDSMDAWQQVLQIAQNELDITIAVDRSAHRYIYRTATIRPR